MFLFISDAQTFRFVKAPGWPNGIANCHIKVTGWCSLVGAVTEPSFGHRKLNWWKTDSPADWLKARKQARCLPRCSGEAELFPADSRQRLVPCAQSWPWWVPLFPLQQTMREKWYMILQRVNLELNRSSAPDAEFQKGTLFTWLFSIYSIIIFQGSFKGNSIHQRKWAHPNEAWHRNPSSTVSAL